MHDCFIESSDFEERLGKAESRSHIRTGREIIPKLADILAKSSFSQCSSRCLESALVVCQFVLGSAGLLGKEDMGVGAVGIQSQGLARQLNSSPTVATEGLVAEILGSFGRRTWFGKGSSIEWPT